MQGKRVWLIPAIGLLLVGWGANQFASMLAFYMDTYGFSQLTVTSMLGIYVAGLLPALLYGGRVSDRLGRKGASLVALLTTIIASIAMIAGAWFMVLIFIGRFLAGVATGAAMAATTAWVKELSQAPWDSEANEGAGARRASLFTTAGFMAGPVASGLIANFAPAPEILPYVVHIVLCLPFLVLMSRLPETRPAQPKGATVTTKKVAAEAYPGARSRFRRVVGVGAPWVFGAGTLGFAVIPILLTDLGNSALLYSTVAVALTLGAGFLVQPLARKLDSKYSARATLSAIGMTLVGMLLGILTGTLQNLWIGLIASTLLGAGYGLMLVSGLLETQRLASPDTLGAVTGKFYTLAYAGYLAPTVLAFFAQWVDMMTLMYVVTALAILSAVIILINSRKFLPQPVESAPIEQSTRS